MWSEDYVRYTNYLEKGIIVLLEGGFKTRYNSDQYEFKLGKLHLLETVKSALTKQVVIDIEPQFINETLIDFIDNNIKEHPGKTALKFNIKESRHNLKVGLYTLESCFTMNDDMAIFLNEHKDLEVSVLTS